MFHIATSHEQSNVMRDDVREKVRWRARRERAEHSSVVVERDECHAAWMSRKYRHRRNFFVAAWWQHAYTVRRGERRGVVRSDACRARA